jgi:dTDP-4-amino-4,6-dideoxygalactose transaminase
MNVYSRRIAINRPILGNEELRAMARVLRSGFLTEKRGSGPNVTRFEAAFAKYVGTKFAIAVNNGTSALHASLLAIGLTAGDEVIVPSLTFVATAEVVALTGAQPIFVDIDPLTYCMDPEEIESVVTERTKAIIPVHLYGLPADMDVIMNLAKDYGLTVIEDAAQAHGAEYKSHKTGSLGNLACFSFYGSKNMTTGEGGMITTNQRDLAESLSLIRNHGEGSYYQSVSLGHNYRMPELEAAIGYVQLQKLPQFLDTRRKNAQYLHEELSNISQLQLPVVPEMYNPAWYVYTIRISGANAAKRNKIMNRIRERRIDAQVYYPRPIHLMTFYRSRYGSTRLPRTETAARQVISLPVHPGLSEKDLYRIVVAVKAAIK